MDKANRENIIRQVKDERVRFIRLQFTDIFGQMKNITITASQLETLDNKMTIDGSSIGVLYALKRAICVCFRIWTVFLFCLGMMMV